MDEKTAELRDVFLEVTDEESVTERQDGGRGTLVDGEDARALDDRLADVVAELREREGLTTPLPDAALVRVVRAFYEGADDAAIAERVQSAAPAGEEATPATDEIDAEAVFRGRLALHLLRDADADAGVDLDALRGALEDAGHEPTDWVADGESDPAVDDEALAEALGVTPDAVARGRRVLATRAAIRRTNDRYRTAFDRILADSELSGSLTLAAGSHGLTEAIEGQEIADDADLSF